MSQEPTPREAILIAVGALLLDLAQVDGDYGGDEDDALVAILERRVGGASRALLDHSRDLVEESADLTDLVGRLAARLSPPQRLDVIGMLCEIALADGHVDRLEGFFITRVGALFELDPADVQARRDAAEARRARG